MAGLSSGGVGLPGIPKPVVPRPVVPAKPAGPPKAPAPSGYKPEQLSQTMTSAPENIAQTMSPLPGSPTTAPGAAPPSAKPAAPGPSALDSTYYLALANATFNEGNRENALNRTSGYAQTGLQNSLYGLQHQQGLDQQKLTDTLNKGNLLQSGHAGLDLANQRYGYMQQQSGLQNTFAEGQAGRDAAVAALKGGLSLEQAALAAAAAERASIAAQKNKALGFPSTLPGTGGMGSGTAPGAGGVNSSLPEARSTVMRALPRPENKTTLMRPIRGAKPVRTNF